MIAATAGFGSKVTRLGVRRFYMINEWLLERSDQAYARLALVMGEPFQQN